MGPPQPDNQAATGGCCPACGPRPLADKGVQAIDFSFFSKKNQKGETRR
jgi:hypothetical protein